MAKSGRPRNPRLQSTKELHTYIKHYIDVNGYAPTVAEMMSAVGVKTTSHIMWLLNRLEEEGKIKRARGVARAINVLED